MGLKRDYSVIGGYFSTYYPQPKLNIPLNSCVATNFDLTVLPGELYFTGGY